MIPVPYIWFAMSLMLTVVYGLHLKHINTIGFDAYIREIEKAHEMNYKDASNNAKFTFWLSWVIVVAGSASTLSAAFYSIKYYINLHA